MMDIFNDLPTNLLLKMVAGLLESVIHANDHRFPSGGPISLFHSRAVPSIKIEMYMARILRYTPFNNDVLLCILVYFDRIARRMSNGPGAFAINSFNIHRLLITNIVVATKYTSDTFYSNARYAKVGGLSLLELNKLELEFLKLCDFELHVRLEAIQEYGEQLMHHTLIHLPKTLGPILHINNAINSASARMTTTATALPRSRKRVLEEAEDTDNDLFVMQGCRHRITPPTTTASTQHPCVLYPMQQHHAKRHRPMSSSSPTKADTTTTATSGTHQSISTA